jgi:hypothetical protein
MKSLLAATAFLVLSPAAFAGEPPVAVCRVSGNTKGPPKVQTADGKVVTSEERDAKAVAALPVCVPVVAQK